MRRAWTEWPGADEAPLDGWTVRRLDCVLSESAAWSPGRADGLLMADCQCFVFIRTATG